MAPVKALLFGGFAATATALAIQAPQQCNVPLPSSGAPVPGNGSPAAYIADNTLQTAAKTAPIPAGYTVSFTNEIGSVNFTEAYLTFKQLGATYDVDSCAQYCDATTGCRAFNTYYSREPGFQIVPGQCENPAPVTNVYCALYNAPLYVHATTNDDQKVTANPNSFTVMQIGSNGYNRISSTPNTPVSPIFHLHSTPDTFAVYANNPITGVPMNDYMAVAYLPASTAPGAVAQQCAEVCRDAAQFNKNCVFFNTYQETVNGVPDANIKCALFGTVASGPAGNGGSEANGRKVAIQGSRTYVCENC